MAQSPSHTFGQKIGELVEYQEAKPVKGFVRYELIARFSNGDEITGSFGNKQDAVAFEHSSLNRPQYLHQALMREARMETEMGRVLDNRHDRESGRSY